MHKPNVGSSGIDNLLRNIQELKKTDIRKGIQKRLHEFRKLGHGSPDIIFRELCFCLLTANCNAQRCICAQREIGAGFITLGKAELKKKIRRLVCRFYNNKTDYIISARSKIDELMSMLHITQDGKSARKWLVKNIKGLGMKEASHFLRNIGYSDVTIIDFHIVDLLEKYRLVKNQNP